MTKTPEFHPLADIFPLMAGAEFDELVADIKVHGLRERIKLLGGKVLDGRNRYLACIKAGMRPEFEHLPAVDPLKYVVSVNIHRRHLAPKQKRDLIARLLKAQPEKSNNAVAKVVKADDKTVASVRRDLEARSEIPNVEKRTDTKGREQPATKSRGWTRERHRALRARKRGRSSPEASADAMRERFAVMDETSEPEAPSVDNPDDKEMKKRRDQFLKDAGAALGYGQCYDGPIDSHVVKVARFVAKTWIELARELRKARHDKAFEGKRVFVPSVITPEQQKNGR